MWAWAALPFALQAVLMLIDEKFHRRRGLPAWERWGHPVDTFVAAACVGMSLIIPQTPAGLTIYITASVFSCLCITKDEWVHARVCTGTENWLHACLFLLHPIILAIAGLWAFGTRPPGFGIFLAIQTGAMVGFGLWQIAYWNGPWARVAAKE
jgi:hypothetical protein